MVLVESPRFRRTRLARRKIFCAPFPLSSSSMLAATASLSELRAPPRGDLGRGYGVAGPLRA